MRKYAPFAVITAAIVVVSCLPMVHPTPPPAGAPAKQVAMAGASVLIGAGDIASCSQSLDQLTAMLVDSVLRADSVEKVSDAVFTLGDNVYDGGTITEFERCFTPTWGDPKKRIMSKIHPAPGNHDYYSPGANPYYLYFGARAGDPKKGYYSYDVGEWRAIVLNSEIAVNRAVHRTKPRIGSQQPPQRIPVIRHVVIACPDADRHAQRGQPLPGGGKFA